MLLSSAAAAGQQPGGATADGERPRARDEAGGDPTPEPAPEPARRAADPTALSAVPLATGFFPDPVRITGRTEGERAVGSMAPRCGGFVGSEPNHVLELRTHFGFLRLFAVAPRSITLAIRTPEGRWQCGGSPLVSAPREEGEFPAGRYEVWIGSAVQGEQIPYDLHVTEFHSVTPATGRVEAAVPVGGGAELGLEVDADEGRFRDRRLRRGFLPDPREDGGEAGGSIDLRLLGGRCEGLVQSRPNHVLTLRNEFDYLRVQIGGSQEPLTLVVRSPGGRYLCSTTDQGRPPMVEQDSWAEGDYRIWVGTRDPDAVSSYRICYTEARRASGPVRCGLAATDSR